MFDYIIINLFSDTTKQKLIQGKKSLFTKINDDKIYLYQWSLQDYSWKKIIADTKNTLRTKISLKK